MTLTFRWPWPLRHVLVEYKHVQLKDRENMMFYSFDLDLDPMTLVLKLDLDMVKMYLYTKNELPSYSSSKVIAWTDRQTHRQTRVKLLPTTYADGNNHVITENSLHCSIIHMHLDWGSITSGWYTSFWHLMKKDLHYYHHPHMRIGNNFTRVCMCICLSVCVPVCLFKL